ncbi:MAG: hypothetical protein QM638_14235 [Nocardioides sp.]|uniref:hypothetical protein n=1 Tax=Nocardioides sp. TaxID=35761 RepID=UPI0039E63C56
MNTIAPLVSPLIDLGLNVLVALLFIALAVGLVEWARHDNFTAPPDRRWFD